MGFGISINLVFTQKPEEPLFLVLDRLIEKKSIIALVFAFLRRFEWGKLTT
jgi:hypothetical protein